jgi:hypothetical protein
MDHLSALRLLGLVAGIAVFVLALAFRGRLRNADVLLLLGVGVALMVVAVTDLADGLLALFDFERGGGGRILGLAVFAIIGLLLLVIRAQATSVRTDRALGAVIEGLAWRELEKQGVPERLQGAIVAVVPAYEEADNLPHVLAHMPTQIEGVPVVTLVVDDGSRDGTAEVAMAHGVAVARHVINRGGGAAVRTGYGLAARGGARIVVTLDADGQHLPEEMPRLVRPILDDQADLVHGSRVLGHAEANSMARELGIVFFNRLVSLMTFTRVTDCSNGYRAVRASVLPRLVLRQEQFHTSEFLIEAIKRGTRVLEVPVTVERRLHGRSKKPAALRYGWGFANAIVRTWLR